MSEHFELLSDAVCYLAVVLQNHTFAPEGPVKVGERVRVLPAHVDPSVAY